MVESKHLRNSLRVHGDQVDDALLCILQFLIIVSLLSVLLLVLLRLLVLMLRILVLVGISKVDIGRTLDVLLHEHFPEDDSSHLGADGKVEHHPADPISVILNERLKQAHNAHSKDPKIGLVSNRSAIGSFLKCANGPIHEELGRINQEASSSCEHQLDAKSPSVDAGKLHEEVCRLEHSPEPSLQHKSAAVVVHHWDIGHFDPSVLLVCLVHQEGRKAIGVSGPGRDGLHGINHFPLVVDIGPARDGDAECPEGEHEEKSNKDPGVVDEGLLLLKELDVGDGKVVGAEECGARRNLDAIGKDFGGVLFDKEVDGL